MTEKCISEGCQLQVEGHCPEHQKEVERRRNTDKVVRELQETVKHFKLHADSMRRSGKRLTRMFWVMAGSMTLLISGMGLTLYLVSYVSEASKDRYSKGLDLATQLRSEQSEIDQQSITRDHIIMDMQETDRAMQTELVKATAQVTTELKNVIKQLEQLQNDIR